MNKDEEILQNDELNESLDMQAQNELASVEQEVESEQLQPTNESVKNQEVEGEVVQGDEGSSEANEEVYLTDLEQAKQNSKWYVLHTFSGYENVAKENLEIVVEKYNLHNRIFDIVIPMEDVVEEKNGKRKIVTRKLMPGYILVKMNYGDDIWHAVTRTRGITGFVGPKGRPLHLTEEEIRKMHLEKVTVVDINIAPNDKVEVLDGPLNGFVGTVIGVDAQASKCRVMVEMFGRETPVDLSLIQIRKIN